MNAAPQHDGSTLEARYRQVRQRVEDYEHLIQALQTIGTSLDVEVILRQMLDAALRLSGAQQGSLTLLDPAPEREGRTLIRGGDADDRLLDHYLNLLLSGWTQRHKRPLLTDNLAETFGAQQIPAKYRAVTSALSMPLQQGSNVIGVINLISLDPAHHFGEREAHLLASLAVQCGHLILHARLHEALFAETSRLRREVMDRYALHGIIGHSPAMQHLFSLLERVLPTEGRVLLEGESGTGKELIARIIHYGGPRKDGPFVAVDCGALPANLLESELFGYVKGAFTGAVQTKKGLFEEAHRGTLFLDEVANMPWEVQAKLLRAIQEGTFRPLGSTQVKHVDARIVAASSQSLRTQVDAGTFRSDLFYRLNVVPVVVPPLRERKTDLPILAQHFLKKVAGAYNKPIRGFQPDTLLLMEHHRWPGNVRELENVVERMVILAEATSTLLTPDLLPPEILGRPPAGFETAASKPADLKTRLERFEKRTLLDVLTGVAWNQSAAARALGLSESTLRYKLQKLGIERPDEPSATLPS
jgi:Nif-specific regulatory protein